MLHMSPSSPSKRLKFNEDPRSSSDCRMSLDNQLCSSDINEMIQASIIVPTHPYHNSACGSILHSTPTNVSSEIFSYLRHGNFDAFRRSLDVYHHDITRMRNEHEQTVLHVLTIHAYPYVWVRLMMMRSCDTCAQDIDGYTAAHYAVERDDVEMLKALTMRFHTQAKPISDEQISAIHGQCLKALTLKDKEGRSAFMLACHRESMKCLNYLIELNINDSHLHDRYGDTCLHYAVARRNQQLIEKLVVSGQANVNGGDTTRPSVLDILQYNRQQQKSTDQSKDDEIEKYLLSHNARNRCTIRRLTNKRKDTTDTDGPVVSNLASLSMDSFINGQMETARSHARLAATLESNGDLQGAHTNYARAMAYTPKNTLDWASYAFHLATIHQAREERREAVDLLQQALETRRTLEGSSEEIDRLQEMINDIQRPIS